MLKNLTWPIVIIASAVIAGLVALSSADGILRQLLLFWFILVCPGMAVIRLLHLGDTLTQTILAVALSLVLATLVAEVMLLAHKWSPTAILTVLIVISLAGALQQIKNTMNASTEAKQAP